MNKIWLILMFSLCSLSLQAQTEDPIGIVLAASGSVTATEPEGTSRTLQRRSALYEGDTISTGPGSRVQFRFNDNGMIALQPESSFFIQTHRFEGQEDGTEEANYSLLRGGLQAITGAIGHTNKEQYQVTTPLANIGLRGTHWTATYCDSSCDGNPPGLYGGVAEGGVDVCNAAGCTAVDADTYFYTPNINTLPETLLAPPSVVFVDTPDSNQSEGAQNALAGTPAGTAGAAAGGQNGNAISEAATQGEQTSQVAEQARENATAFDEDESPVAEQALANATAFRFAESPGGSLPGNGRAAPNENALENSNAFRSSGGDTTDDASTTDPLVSETSDTLSEITEDELAEVSGHRGNSSGAAGNSGGSPGNSGNSSNNNGGSEGNGNSDTPGNGTVAGNSGNTDNDNPSTQDPPETCDLLCRLAENFGDDAEYSSNSETENRRFTAFWGRWSGSDSSGNQLDDHFVFSEDLTTELPQSGSLSYRLLGATTPTNQRGQEGVLNSVEMLIDFDAQEIQSLALNLEISRSVWNVSNAEPSPLGTGADIEVLLSGLCAGQCATRFESVPATGTSSVTLVGPDADGALGTYDLQTPGTHTASGAFVLETD